MIRKMFESYTMVTLRGIARRMQIGRLGAQRKAELIDTIMMVFAADHSRAVRLGQEMAEFARHGRLRVIDVEAALALPEAAELNRLAPVTFDCVSCGRKARTAGHGDEHVEPSPHVNAIHVPVRPTPGMFERAMQRTAGDSRALLNMIGERVGEDLVPLAADDTVRWDNRSLDLDSIRSATDGELSQLELGLRRPDGFAVETMLARLRRVELKLAQTRATLLKLRAQMALSA